MRRNMIAIVATTTAAVGGVLMFAQPAAAGQVQSQTAAQTAAQIMAQAKAKVNTQKVVVTVKANGAKARSATLNCNPVGGTHSAAAAACQVLQTAGGDPAAIVATDTFCTMEYAPVKVTVVGKWNGKNVRFKETFSNSCRTTAEGGALFQI